ncbi:VOC family protein [Spelaeicoccus albus]|uniref:Catechol 2,3-dioxygenase-like lactoylglutathione lyase family enzyme n=1 Tax=Spelaeicoccus albus TaxID=1280376 RepID=A0A7Z0D364_9MICO|nr:VOC family protein [Spelaeicoccus albus]NYI68037.1 catechol 2,3-dioxygenase-like lactoylglutathione lyase family enzyme [Spelaeicoccus albus]
MITSIASAILYVGDQDLALQFYRDILGFDVVMDADMGENFRWLEVKPSGGQSSIVLAAAEAFGKQPGEGAYLTFATDDVEATVEELRARGATTSEVTREPWGTYATVNAPDGHQLQFNERPQN